MNGRVRGAPVCPYCARERVTRREEFKARERALRRGTRGVHEPGCECDACRQLCWDRDPCPKRAEAEGRR